MTIKNSLGYVHTDNKFVNTQPALHHNNNKILSDEQVRDIRIRFHHKHESITTINSVYPNISEKYIYNIVKYYTRLRRSCEI